MGFLATEMPAHPEIKYVENFYQELKDSWNENYSEWPHKSFFLPPIFLRDVKENLRLYTRRSSSPSRSSKLLSKYETIQGEEDFKEDLFRSIECMFQNEISNTNLFLIYKLNINKELANKIDSRMEDLQVPSMQMDFQLFTSKGHVILIKYTFGNVENGIKHLKRLEDLFNNLLMTKHNNLCHALKIHCAICSDRPESHSRQDKEKSLYYFTELNQITEWITNILTSPKENEESDICSLIQTMSFIRKLEDDKNGLRKQLLSHKELMETVAKSLFHSKISTDRPITLVPVKQNEGILRVNDSYLIYDMTEQQVDLLTSTQTTNLILGPAGTGKTLLTKFRILQKLLKDSTKSIAIFVPENMIEEYKMFIHWNAQLMELSNSANISFYTISNRERFLSELLNELRKGAGIFMDDSQHMYQFQEIFKSPEIKSELIKWRANPELELWICLDWVQFLISGPLISENLSIPEWLFPKAVKRLEIVMRNTTQIMHLVSYINDVLKSLLLAESSMLRGILQIEKGPQMNPERASNSEDSLADNLAASHLNNPETVIVDSLFNAPVEGHKISGTPIRLFCWKNSTKSPEEISISSNVGVGKAISFLNDTNSLAPEKTAIIYSASFLDSAIQPLCTDNQEILRLFSFQVSAQ